MNKKCFQISATPGTRTYVCFCCQDPSSILLLPAVVQESLSCLLAAAIARVSSKPTIGDTYLVGVEARALSELSLLSQYCTRQDTSCFTTCVHEHSMIQRRKTGTFPLLRRVSREKLSGGINMYCLVLLLLCG